MINLISPRVLALPVTYKIVRKIEWAHWRLEKGPKDRAIQLNLHRPLQLCYSPCSFHLNSVGIYASISIKYMYSLSGSFITMNRYRHFGRQTAHCACSCPMGPCFFGSPFCFLSFRFLVAFLSTLIYYYSIAWPFTSCSKLGERRLGGYRPTLIPFTDFPFVPLAATLRGPKSLLISSDSLCLPFTHLMCSIGRTVAIHWYLCVCAEPSHTDWASQARRSGRTEELFPSWRTVSRRCFAAHCHLKDTCQELQREIPSHMDLMHPIAF